MPGSAESRHTTSGVDGAATDLRERLCRAESELAAALAENARLKAEFLQAQKMEAVGRLASGVAHDFKNVLTLIAGYADQLLARAATRDVRDPLAEIAAACKRAITLAEQLLSYSRRDAAHRAPVSLNTILADAGRMLRRMLPANVDLVIRQAPSLGLVLANAGHMHQVLLNLVVNARDAMPSGGRLVVEVSDVEVGGGAGSAPADVTPGPYVRLSVSDNGVGMDDETRRRALEPFFTTKDGRVGTGLGLSTVDNIVREAGGWIALESARGAGTTVFVYLPRLGTDAAATRSGSLPAGESAVPRPRVLVIDDDEAVRKLMLDLLAVAGYHVTAAAVPPAADTGADDSAYDVVVADLATVDLGSASFRPRPDGRVPKIVGITTGPSRPAVACANRLELGAAIGKPIVPRQLLRAVRDMLEAN
jgi:signal transduction histidine kinase/CheY-like chemotaxis protein